MSNSDRDWPFRDPPNTRAFTCRHVWDDGAPIVYVSHDDDGDWQFLCGGQHDDESGEKPRLLCLEHLLDHDATLGEIAGMHRNHEAQRDGVGAPWRLHDRAEDVIHEHVNEYGWHVVMIEGSDDLPSFAYSIGLYRTFGHPEIIAFGLPLKVLHQLINNCGDRIKAGERLSLDEPVSEILKGYPCVFKDAPKACYGEYVGYARWYYDGDDFPLIQLVWPDRDGRFPWAEGVTDNFRGCQPILADDENEDRC